MDDLRQRLDDLDERLGRVEDERAITHLMYRYIHACDVVRDAEVVSGYFTPDAVWEGQGHLAEFKAAGRDGIREMFRGNPSMLPFTAHFLTNPVVGLSMDRTKGWGRWHTLEAATLSDGETAVWMIAYYDNDFVKQGGEWKIAHLRFEDRVICPYEDGWALTRYVSPVTLERLPQPRPPRSDVAGSHGAPNLGSLLIGSPQPAVTKNWYRRAFDAEENEMGALQFGPVQLFIEEHSKVHGRAEEPARCLINLDTHDARSLAAHLRDLDTPFVRELTETPFGLIGTVADPDGNYVQIIQWTTDGADHA